MGRYSAEKQYQKAKSELTKSALKSEKDKLVKAVLLKKLQVCGGLVPSAYMYSKSPVL